MSKFMSEQPELVVSLSVLSASALAYYITRPFPRRNTTPLSRDIGHGVRISALCTGDQLRDDPFDGVETLYDAFKRGYSLSKNKQCLGYRDGEKYVWITYHQLQERVINFGSGLIEEGIVPKKDVYIGIIGINCIDWVVAQLGSTFYSIIFVPMYDTLGDEAMRYILQQTGCEIVVAHPSKIEKVQTFLKHGPNKVRVLVKMMEDPTGAEKESCSELGVKIKSMEEVEALGRTNPRKFCVPMPEDIYTICYTSGTTGIPKGAMISHKNMTTTMAGVMLTNKDFILSPNEVHYSYLPLCHLFEMNVHMFVYCGGASIGFFSGDPAQIPEDLKTLRPTIFPAVPRVLNKFRDRIIKTVSEKGAVANWLFNKALNSKYEDLNNGIMRRNIWDTIILQKIRDQFGGRISLIATGAAPILPQTLNFFRAVFGANVYEGFGQTESTAGCTFTQPGDFSGGHVGPPLPSNYIKLIDSAETGHLVSEGKGEICIKGKSVFLGYYKDDENTTEAIDSDGWLHTGDIGEWNEVGCLRVIDRKKYIFKTSLGEYIAPEKIENTYELHELVQQMFMDGNSLKPGLAAIIIPDEDNLLQFAASIGKGALDYDAILDDPEINSKVLGVLNEFAKSRLKSFELVKKMRLVNVELTVENDLVTPTFKKKRPGLKRHFSQMFDIMYSEIP